MNSTLLDGLKGQKMKTAYLKKEIHELGLIVLCPWATLLKCFIFSFLLEQQYKVNLFFRIAPGLNCFFYLIWYLLDSRT